MKVEKSGKNPKKMLDKGGRKCYNKQAVRPRDGTAGKTRKKLEKL